MCAINKAPVQVFIVVVLDESAADVFLIKLLC